MAVSQARVEAILGAALLLGCLTVLVVVHLGKSSSEENGLHDRVNEVLVPVLVTVGLGVTVWRLWSRESAWWVVPAAGFLLGAVFPMAAWADASSRDGDGCANEGFLPESARGLAVGSLDWILFAVLALLIVGLVLFVLNGRRRIGAWCLLAAATLLAGIWALTLWCI